MSFEYIDTIACMRLTNGPIKIHSWKLVGKLRKHFDKYLSN